MLQKRPTFQRSFARMAPDLIIGLLGIPVALAFQEISGKVIDMVSSDDLANSIGVFYILVVFVYLASIYVLLASLTVSAAQEGVPEHLHSRLGTYGFIGCLVVGAILTGLFAATATNTEISTPLRSLTFLALAVAMGMEWRVHSSRACRRYRERQEYRSKFFFVLFAILLISHLLWYRLIDEPLTEYMKHMSQMG